MEEELDLSYLDREDIDDDVVGVDFNIVAMLHQQLQITTSLVALTMLCIVCHALNILNMFSSDPSSVSNFLPDKDRRRQELMSYLVHTTQCRDIIRMGQEAFINLCERLRSTGLVKDAIRSTVEEQVAQFLYIVGHNVKNRSVAFFFHRSGATVSKFFHNVLDAVITLESEFLTQPSGDEVHPYVLNNTRFYPYFKDCLGVIDGTHVRVRVAREDAPRFRGRKDWPTQNVFAACDFAMKFTYVLAGWEGTASDSRILKNALDRDDPLVIPQGKYYLGDAGFMLKSTVMTPYRGVRYHLKEFSRRGPQNARELFNHRHSSLRNVIERTFGVLKKRFSIIASGTEPHYELETMMNIILACCILHNFIRGVDRDDPFLNEVDNELNEREEQNVSSSQVREDDYRLGSTIRDAIADQMWRDYQNSFNMDRGKGAATDTCGGMREFCKWTEDMDAKLLHSMIEENRLGNRIDGSWTTQAYNNMVQFLHNAGYVYVTKANVKNRQKVLKDRWREAHDLFSGLSGFAWNSVSMRFEAEDEVWADLIQVFVKH
ncbi:uncharacterized protein HKW66_Vig0100570 [Vigna angularis]|uniref:DDE Tnp4 domain-containing protein n=1 Tax=Phaseolus angularis TaxID=3914 RepID=A0A8T0KLY9_PHAAN|nr:uncharacterized protein HKW66_Vig0100570 [Vigna angularis]